MVRTSEQYASYVMARTSEQYTSYVMARTSEQYTSYVMVRTSEQYTSYVMARTSEQYTSYVMARTSEQYTSYVMARTSYIRRDDDDVRSVLEQHVQLDVYSASSLKQQSSGRHVAPLKHIILIPNQPVFGLHP